MAYFPSSDYSLEVRRGNVPGHALAVLRGFNDDLGTNPVTIAPTLASGDIDQSDIAATPATVDVASTSANDVDTTGTGLRTLTLIGLDASGDLQTETIAMNGQTEVTSANTYSAILGWEQASVGSNNGNEGVIWIGNGTFTAGVPATKYFAGEVGFNRGMTAYYVVPNAKKFYGQRFVGAVATASKDVKFSVQLSTDGAVWETVATFGLVSGASIVSEDLALEEAVAGTHIRVVAVSSAATSSISVILSGELVDD